MQPEIDLIFHSGHRGHIDYCVSLARAIGSNAPVTLVTSNKLEQRYRVMGIPTALIFGRARYYIFNLMALIARYILAKPRTVVFQSWLLVPLIDGLLVRFLSKLGHKTFVTVHDTLPHYPWPWSKLELTFYYRSFDGIIALSENSSNDLRKMGIICPILVVPHGIYDIFKTREITKSLARELTGIPAGGKSIILQFGTIDRRKGCFEFLEVARRCQDLENVHFVLAGPNDLSKKDRRLLDTFRLMPNLTIRDYRIDFENVQLYFCSADFVAQPYLEGTTSGVYKLALAFSVPVLASEVGDLREIISRGSAISIGSDANILDALERFLRSLRDGTNEKVEKVRRNLKRETDFANWSKIALSHLNFFRSYNNLRIQE